MNGVLTEELAMSAHFSFYFIGWGLINNYKLHVYKFVYFVYLYIYIVFLISCLYLTYVLSLV